VKDPHAVDGNSRHLYETHIPVADTNISEAFYREMVGLPFAYRDPTRDIVFLWADEKQKGMIGLWGASTGYGRQHGVLTRCHLAFALSFEELRRVLDKLNHMKHQPELAFGDRFEAREDARPTGLEQALRAGLRWALRERGAWVHDKVDSSSTIRCRNAATTRSTSVAL